jgi:hypothetical protein
LPERILEVSENAAHGTPLSLTLLSWGKKDEER